uniref:Uncharacterized protein n=1 Tax=Pararge aegeria TaxID=116150 RepID=S4P7E8_9NEOP
MAQNAPNRPTLGFGCSQLFFIHGNVRWFSMHYVSVNCRYFSFMPHGSFRGTRKGPRDFPSPEITPEKYNAAELKIYQS